MKKKGPQALTGTELNAAVYKYLQESGIYANAMAGISVDLLSSSENLEDLCLEITKRKKNSEVKGGSRSHKFRLVLGSGFVHTAYNFFYEAGIGKDNIQGMIPQGALIRIVQKGLQYIELEANSEIGSDDEHHFFESLDLMTNDLDELTKKITSNGKHSSVKNDKEQKIDSVETDKAQNIGSAETTTTSRKLPMWKTKAARNSKPDETAAMRRAQPVKHAKAQNISSAETVQKTGSVEITTGLECHLSWIGRKPRLRKRKH